MAAVLVLLASGRPAGAHPTPSSVVYLDLTVSGAALELHLPIEELVRGMALPGWEAAPGELPARLQPAIAAYLLEHIKPTTSGTGQRWPVRFLRLAVDTTRDPTAPELVAYLAATAPGPARSIDLHYDVITHQVRSHYTYVYARSNFGLGQVKQQPQLVTTIHFNQRAVTVKRGGSFLRGFVAVVALGMEHVATGFDHVLFVFLLLLPAPLVHGRRRWSTFRGTRASLLAVLRVLTAFTVGHSLTLAAGALGAIRVPSTPVEVGIALSLLVAAVHALRPLFPWRESWVAAGFGLVHGLAFASTLVGRDLGTAQTLVTLCGFNLGIELEQFGLVLMVFPWLLLLAKTRAYPWLRSFGGVVGGALACGFLIERTLGIANPLQRVIDLLAAHAGTGLAILAAVALFAVVREHHRAAAAGHVAEPLPLGPRGG